MLLIMLNTVVMVLDSPTASVDESRVFQALEIVFTAVFASEMAMKLVVNGWGYWDHTLNVLDAVIVTLSVFALPFNILALAADAEDSDLLDIVRAVLIFRVLRLVRLMLRIPGMQELIRTAFKSTHALANLVGLTVFMTCVYALLGMQLFGGRFPEADALADERLRFDTFFQSGVTLFVLLTYDGWSSVTQNTWVSSASWAAMPYVLFWLFFGLVLTNWYVAVILEGFEQAEAHDTFPGTHAFPRRSEAAGAAPALGHPGRAAAGHESQRAQTGGNNPGCARPAAASAGDGTAVGSCS